MGEKIDNLIPLKYEFQGTDKENKIRMDLKNEIGQISRDMGVKGGINTLEGYINFSQDNIKAMENLFDKFSSRSESGRETLQANGPIIFRETYSAASAHAQKALAEIKQAQNDPNMPINFNFPKDMSNSLQSMVECGEKLCKQINQYGNSFNIAKEQLNILKNNTKDGVEKNYTEIANAIQILSGIANDMKTAETAPQRLEELDNMVNGFAYKNASSEEINTMKEELIISKNEYKLSTDLTLMSEKEKVAIQNKLARIEKNIIGLENKSKIQPKKMSSAAINAQILRARLNSTSEAHKLSSAQPNKDAYFASEDFKKMSEDRTNTLKDLE